MPNPVPLASEDDERRRAWVTQHHEVVRLVKDCFGDRFSNNEIFDRLKISRRTGYRALGNDERIGKAPGRKPKIKEETIKDMIEYIESGGCGDVGNVWKHLAEKFAPNCNPKTVQDAIKKSGFVNYRDTVNLQPLLNEQLADTDLSPEDEEQQRYQREAALEHGNPAASTTGASTAAPHSSPPQSHQTPDQTQAPPPPPQQQQPTQQQQQQQQHQQSVLDPAFQTQSTPEILRNAIDSAPQEHVRYVLHELTQRQPDMAHLAASFLCPFLTGPPANPLGQLTQPLSAQQLPAPGSIHPDLQGPLAAVEQGLAGGPAKRSRTAICRRCNQQYDRVLNTMDNRECLYHKGSPQKINPEEPGTLEQAPQAFIWSCCGGNGLVRGCCRAMHTTKKKRKYSKKRDASTAGLDDTPDANGLHHGDEGDDDDDDDDNHHSRLDGDADDAAALMDGALDPNIDAALQDVHPVAAHHAYAPPSTGQLAQGPVQGSYQGAGMAPQAAMQAQHPHLTLGHGMQSDAANLGLQALQDAGNA